MTPPTQLLDCECCRADVVVGNKSGESGCPPQVESACPPEVVSKCPTEVESKCPPQVGSECPPQVECECPPQVASECPPQVESECPPQVKYECPPMPSFSTGDSKPDWFCSPTVPSKTYRVPEGVTIIPISGGAGFGVSSSRGSCSTEVGPGLCKQGSQKNACTTDDVPILEPQIPAEEQGFFSRISAFFCSSTAKEEINDKSEGVAQDEKGCREESTSDPILSSLPTNQKEEVNEPPCVDPQPIIVLPKPSQDYQKAQNGRNCAEDEGRREEPKCDQDFSVTLPDRDERDISVRAQEWVDKSCTCSQCTTLPIMDENGEPLPVECPNVTCGECGYIRGQNLDCCIMCRFSVAMKKEGDQLRNRALCAQCQPPEEESVDKCVPVLDPDMAPFQWSQGKPVYEGGMSLTRTQRFLWQQGSCDGEGFRALAVEGQTLRGGDDDEGECSCGEDLQKLKYRGGMSLEEAQEWLWIKNKYPQCPPRVQK